MDITYIDGTGHGITFYDSDDNDDGSRFSMSDERENLIYNGDFSKINSSEDAANRFLAWTGQNMNDVVGYDYVQGGAWIKNFIRNSGGSLTLPENLMGFRQTSDGIKRVVRDYEFIPGKEYTLSFDAFINKKEQNTKDLPYIWELNRNLLRNTSFLYGHDQWTSLYTGLNEEPLQAIEIGSPLVSEIFMTFAYPGDSTQQYVNYYIDPKKYYTISLDVHYTPDMVFYHGDENPVFEAEIIYFLKSDPGSSYRRTTYINVPITGVAVSDTKRVAGVFKPDESVNFAPEDILGIDIAVTRYDDLYESGGEVSHRMIMYGRNQKLECGNPDEGLPEDYTHTVWSEAKEDAFVPIDYSQYTGDVNLINNGDFNGGAQICWDWLYCDEIDYDAMEDILINPVFSDEDMYSFWLYEGNTLRQWLSYKFSESAYYYTLSINYTATTSVTLKPYLKYFDHNGIYLGDSEISRSSISIQPTAEGEIGTIQIPFAAFEDPYLAVIDASNVGAIEFLMRVNEDALDTTKVVDIKSIAIIEGQETVDYASSIMDSYGINNVAYKPVWFIEGFDSPDDLYSETCSLIFRGIQNGTSLPYILKTVSLSETRTRFITNFIFDNDIDGFELYFGAPPRSLVNAIIRNVQLETGLEASVFHLSNYERGVVSKANTWTDWHIVPTSRPVFNPPTPKTIFVDVPGSNNKLDLTQAITRYVKYDSREGDIEFLVDSQYRWMDVYEKIMKFLHGQELDAVLDDDPEYYYRGRFSVDKWNPGQEHSTITIKYVVDAYKYEKYCSTDDWLWDPFSFETGIVRDYGNINVSNYMKLYVNVSDMPVIPEFIVSGIKSGSSFLVKWDNNSYKLTNGSQHVAQIEFGPNTENLLEFYGSAIVSIKFKGGKL